MQNRHFVFNRRAFTGGDARASMALKPSEYTPDENGAAQ